jgi:steroid delta-isomerase-like uncharacterized protein
MKKMFLFLPFVVLFVLSCQDKQLKSELGLLKAKSQTEEQNKIIVEKFLAGWNNKDLSVWADLVDPQFGLYIPSISQNPMTLEQTKNWGESIFKSFPDTKYNIKDILADGDKVIVWWTFTGTHKGEWGGIPATGKKIMNSAIEIYKLQNGKIIEERTEVDGTSFNQQLGLEWQFKK